MFSEDLHNEMAQMGGDDLAAMTFNSDCPYEANAAEAILQERDEAQAALRQAARNLMMAAQKCNLAGCDSPVGYDWGDVVSMANDWRS